MNPAIPAYEAAVDLLRRSMAIEDRAAADLMQQQPHAADPDGSATGRRPTRDDVVAALLAIADDPPVALQRIAAPIPCMRDSLSFHRLERLDVALVDVLLATGRFDVALVNFKVGKKGGYANILSVVEPHVACMVPRNVASSLVGKKVHAYLGDASNVIAKTTKSPSCAIVFWPMRFRAGIIGLDAALRLARKAIDNVPSCDRVRFRNVLLDVLSALVLVDHPRPNQLDAITKVFIQCHDVALARLLLCNALSLRGTKDLKGVGMCIHALLASYGWIPLFAALQALFERSKRAHGNLCHLLASLAGLVGDDDALCPPLQQPFVCELIKMCYNIVLGSLKSESAAATMRYWILLDWYLDDVAPYMPHGNWIGTRLPPALLVVVDSYLFRRPFDKVLASGGYTLALLLRNLSSGLVAAIAHQPTLRQSKYVAAISTTTSDILAVLPTVTWMCPNDVRDIVDAMHTLGRCDETLLHALRRISDHEDLIAGLLRFLQHPTSPVASCVHSLVASYIVSVAPALNVTEVDGRMREGHDLTAVVTSVVDALHVLALVASHEVRNFAVAWAATLPETLDANRKALYAVVVQAFERLPHDTGLLSDLASLCLANFEKGCALTPEPDGREIAIDDVAVDVDHCAQCATFADFLRNDARMEFEFEIAGLCNALQVVVARHPGQLGLLNESTDIGSSRTDDIYDDMLHLRRVYDATREAMMGPYVVRKRATQFDDATDLNEHVRRLWQLHSDTKSVAKLQKLLAIETADMDDEQQPPSKRPRLEDS